ncbi:MAG: PTS sugar transporter subunit IIB [Bacilli bacterium]
MIKLVRLDYRLLHGQVVFAWTGHIKAQRIIIIDDFAYIDKIKKTALKLSNPPGVKLNIFSLEVAISKVDKILGLNENIMLIFGNTNALKNFIRFCPEIKEVNYGGLANKEGKKKFSSAIFMNDSEIRDTKEILESGVRIFVQQTPSVSIEALDIN